MSFVRRGIPAGNHMSHVMKTQKPTETIEEGTNDSHEDMRHCVLKIEVLMILISTFIK